MKVRLSTVAAGLICALAVTATPVTTTAFAAPARAAATHPTTYTHHASGSTITIAPGTVFRVHLLYNTGYGNNWYFGRRPNPNVVHFLGRHNAGTKNPPAIGGENSAYFTFKAAAHAHGKTIIKLLRHHSNLGEGTGRKFILTVRVR